MSLALARTVVIIRYVGAKRHIHVSSSQTTHIIILSKQTMSLEIGATRTLPV